MISISQYEMPAIVINAGPEDLPADAVSRILDVAEFYRSKHETDGTVSQWFRLRKPLPGKPAGLVLSLAALHEALFTKAKK